MKLDEDAPEALLEVMKTKAGGWLVHELETAAKEGPETIYAALANLEERGLVTSEWASPEAEGIRRRLYSVAEEVVTQRVVAVVSVPSGTWTELPDGRGFVCQDSGQTSEVKLYPYQMILGAVGNGRWTYRAEWGN